MPQTNRQVVKRTRWAWTVVALFMSSTASAYFDFVPTPIEWAAWPEYCRIQYNYIMGWRGSEYGSEYSQATIEGLRSQIGPRTFDGLHHYCAGMHYLNRSRAERDPQSRQFLLNQALEETLYTHRSADPLSPYFVKVVVSLASIKRAKGDYDGAIAELKGVLGDHPTLPETYGALAMIYRQRGRLAEARDVLEAGNKATEGTSAEMNYNLGLIELELGRKEDAVVHAKRAYELGHPLPALRDKLRALGLWVD